MAFGKIKADKIAYTNTNNVEVEANVRLLVDNATAVATNTTNIASNTTAIANKADLASPALTGTPTAPTAISGTNTTQLATTEFVQSALPDITGKADLAGATFTGDVSFDGEAILKGDGGITPGRLTLNCEQNSHGVKIQAPTHSAAATYTLHLPDTAGAPGYALTTNGSSGNLSWVDYLRKDGGTVTGNVVVTGDLTGTGDITRTGDLTLTGNTDLTGGLDIDGAYTQTAETVGTGVTDIDLSTGNYFTKAISTTTNLAFINPPAAGTVGSFVIEADVTGNGTSITWPTNVYWNSGANTTAPTLTDNNVHLFVFTTTDGGTTYRGAALVDYTT